MSELISIKQCLNCNSSFQWSKLQSNKRFCSAKCRVAYHDRLYIMRRGVEKICSNCEKKFKLDPRKRNVKGRGLYCSQVCLYETRRKKNLAGNLAERLGIKRGANQRIRAMMKINPELKCENCGCNDLRILEINHKNGGGGKEMLRGRRLDHRQISIGLDFYDNINTGRRKTDDLNLLCRVCNAVHYAELKGVKGFVISYKKPVGIMKA